MSRASIGLLVGIALLTITGFAVYLALNQTAHTEASAVLMLIGGFTLMGGVVSLVAAVQGSSPAVVHVHFNEELATAPLRRLAPDVIDAQVVAEPGRQDEVTADTLIGRDNTLALAKLRIDLERELTRFARQHDFDLKTSYLSPSRLVEQLAERHLIASDLVPLWKDVLSTCNKAVHGGAVDTNSAESVIRVGAKLVAVLRRSSARANGGT